MFIAMHVLVRGYTSLEVKGGEDCILVYIKTTFLKKNPVSVIEASIMKASVTNTTSKCIKLIDVLKKNKWSYVISSPE